MHWKINLGSASRQSNCGQQHRVWRQKSLSRACLYLNHHYNYTRFQCFYSLWPSVGFLRCAAISFGQQIRLLSWDGSDASCFRNFFSEFFSSCSFWSLSVCFNQLLQAINSESGLGAQLFLLPLLNWVGSIWTCSPLYFDKSELGENLRRGSPLNSSTREN